MSNLCRNINHEKGAKPVTFDDGRGTSGRKLRARTWCRQCPPVSRHRSRLTGGARRRLSPPAGPGGERGASTGPVTWWACKSQAGLFPFAGSPRLSADSRGQSSIRIPQVYLCEHPLASVSAGSSRLHLWRPSAVCSQAPGCWACKPRGPMVLGDRGHAGTAAECPAQARGGSAASPGGSWDHPPL